MDIVAGSQSLHSNPFIILTFIVAPAILTNASALMVLSTSNRFARAIDRARELSRQIEEARRASDLVLLDRIDAEIRKTEKRAVLLLQATRSFYFSLGGFAFGAVLSLLGAGLVSLHIEQLNGIFALTAVSAVFMAVGGLVLGSILLFYETRIVVGILQDRIQRLDKQHTAETIV